MSILIFCIGLLAQACFSAPYPDTMVSFGKET